MGLVAVACAAFAGVVVASTGGRDVEVLAGGGVVAVAALAEGDVEGDLPAATWPGAPALPGAAAGPFVESALATAGLFAAATFDASGFAAGVLAEGVFDGGVLDAVGFGAVFFAVVVFAVVVFAVVDFANVDGAPAFCPTAVFAVAFLAAGCFPDDLTKGLDDVDLDAGFLPGAAFLPTAVLAAATGFPASGSRVADVFLGLLKVVS